MMNRIPEKIVDVSAGSLALVTQVAELEPLTRVLSAAATVLYFAGRLVQLLQEQKKRKSERMKKAEKERRERLR